MRMNEEVEYDDGVLCTPENNFIHELKYVCGWYCPKCNAVLRLSVWYGSETDLPRYTTTP